MRNRILKLLPQGVRACLRRARASLQRWLKRFVIGSLEIKYVPYRYLDDDFILPPDPPTANEGSDQGMAIPPKTWWFEYGKTREEWLAGGERHTSTMFEAVRASGLSLGKGDRILELGCGCGRMLRHLKPLAESCEIWGTDVLAEQIYWNQQHLSPPFHFATTTTIPHLPFEEKYFKLVFCGSVFTHIEDLADAWLLEIRRILAPDGRLYITIHDKHTLELLNGPYQGYGLAKYVKERPMLRKSGGAFEMLVFSRDILSQVFYDLDYYRKHIGGLYDVLSVIPEAYGYQTGILLKKKPSL